VSEILKIWEAMEAHRSGLNKVGFRRRRLSSVFSASHISRLLLQLEAELGTTLVISNTRRIRLSEAG